MPMCRFGCDELYEKGYVAIKNGKVIDTITKYKTEIITDYINSIVDRDCNWWSDDTEQYFMWHCDLHTK